VLPAFALANSASPHLADNAEGTSADTVKFSDERQPRRHVEARAIGGADLGQLKGCHSSPCVTGCHGTAPARLRSAIRFAERPQRAAALMPSVRGDSASGIDVSQTAAATDRPDLRAEEGVGAKDGQAREHPTRSATLYPQHSPCPCECLNRRTREHQQSASAPADDVA
jgi:hypothetical protein